MVDAPNLAHGLDVGFNVRALGVAAGGDGVSLLSHDVFEPVEERWGPPKHQKTTCIYQCPLPPVPRRTCAA